jgi:hypothetical protein
MPVSRFFLLSLLLGLLAAHSSAADPAADPAAKIDAADFDRLHKVIKPQSGESPWRDIRWHTNVTEARRAAIAQDKPIVILTAADGSPLSRT